MISTHAEGPSLEQAPPLSIPVSFFALGALACAGAGVLLLLADRGAVQTHWHPVTLSLVHLLTLGFLGLVMCGALYQILPVLAGRRMPLLPLAWVVLGLLGATVAGVAFAAFGRGPGYFVAFSLATSALFLVCILAGVALWRSRARSPSVWGLRCAILSLLLTVLAGSWMSHGFGGYAFPGDRGVWIQAHLSIALLGWVGGLIVSVSWQVVPMFYVTPELPRRGQWLTLAAIASSVVLVLGVLIVHKVGRLAVEPTRVATGLAALPGALALGVLHPVQCLRALHRRRRRRVDVSVRFWRLGLCLAPGCLLVGILAELDVPRCDRLLLWSVLFGYAGTIVHGMLGRILPFLFWFHRYSPLVGRVPVPSMRELLPERNVQRGFWVHAATLLAGALAILFESSLLVTLAASGLVVTGVILLGHVGTLLAEKPTRKAGSGTAG